VDEAREVLTGLRSMPLAEAADFMSVSEERAIQLARQGRVEASEDEDGWHFDKRSIWRYESELVLGPIMEVAREHSEDFARTVEP